MTKEFQLRVEPEVAAQADSLRRHLILAESLNPDSVRAIHVERRSIDARQRNVFVNLKVKVFLDEDPPKEVFERIVYQNVEHKPAVVIVGAGPGGLFAALRLIELGLRPIVIERGKNVHERKKDLAQITKLQHVDPESNYCFGEGGAGAYSDGKLYTRSKKRGNVEKVLRVFCQHGASGDILVDAHPHIGTDRLPSVIENMRNTIIASGGEVHFQTKMTRLIIDEGNDGKAEVKGVEAVCYGHEQTFIGPVILATGHSARDVYRGLVESGVRIEAKGIAVGVRLEHPSKLIDQIQYHSVNGRGKWLPAAEYSYVTQIEGRGVYSFCMCPGGFVIPASTGPEQIVVNGMSPASRGTRWSNSGMVVELRPEDLLTKSWERFFHISLSAAEGSEIAGEISESVAKHPELIGMQAQFLMERACWLASHQSQRAPAQRMGDFVDGRESKTLPVSSYAPGLLPATLNEILPAPVALRLRQGFLTFGKQSKGFLTNDAVVIGTETRTSSPVRIPRDAETMEHVSVCGLFPCGEGAGYAGGIVSAAIDGERCAEYCQKFIAQKMG